MDSIKSSDNNTETVSLLDSNARKVTKMKALKRLLTEPLTPIKPVAIEQPVQGPASSVATVVHRKVHTQSCGIDTDFKHYLDNIARRKSVNDRHDTDRGEISKHVKDVTTEQVHIKEESEDSNDFVEIISQPGIFSHAKEPEPAFKKSNAPGGLFSNLLVKLADTVRNEHTGSGNVGASMSASFQKSQNDSINTGVSWVKETAVMSGGHNVTLQSFDNDMSYNSDIEGSDYSTTSGSQSSRDSACLNDFDSTDAQSYVTPNTENGIDSVLKQPPMNVQYASHNGLFPISLAQYTSKGEMFTSSSANLYEFNKFGNLPASSSSESTGNLLLECVNVNTMQNVQTVSDSSLNGVSDVNRINTVNVEVEDHAVEAIHDSVDEEKGSSLNGKKVDEITNIKIEAEDQASEWTSSFHIEGGNVVYGNSSLGKRTEENGVLNMEVEHSSLNKLRANKKTVKVKTENQPSEEMKDIVIGGKLSNNGKHVDIMSEVGNYKIIEGNLSESDNDKNVKKSKVMNCTDIEESVSDNGKSVDGPPYRSDNNKNIEKSEVISSTAIDENVSDNGKIVDGPPYRCEICDKDFKWKHNLRYHMDTHTGKTPFQCEVCHKLFSHRGNLDSHRLIHTGETPYHCKVCNRGFTQRGHLKTHEYIHSGEYPFKCKECDKAFRDTTSLKRHMYNHVKETPFKCELCDKYFKRSRLLKAHMLSHAGKTLYPCQFCEKGFTEASSLQTHMYKHTGEKPFACELCDERFAHTGALKIHVYKHKGEQPYKCEVCSKGFWQSSNWKSHLMIHTGERPYTCKECGKGFIQVYSLQQHQRTHTGDKPYACNLCSKVFAYSSTYKKHMHRVHMT